MKSTPLHEHHQIRGRAHFKIPKSEPDKITVYPPPSINVSEPVRHPIAETLKSRAIRLADEGTIFLNERSTAAPTVYHGSGNEDVQANAQFEYDSKTQSLWFKRFGSRFAEVHRDLLKAGVHDNRLDVFAREQYIGASDGIREIMSHLAKVAESLP